MLHGCAGVTNTTTLCKMERVMSKGVCQELHSTHNWKRATEVGDLGN